ncbi:MAG TPA: hypothetical protein VH415_03135 [Nitrososphaeraceae archaeon]
MSNLLATTPKLNIPNPTIITKTSAASNSRGNVFLIWEVAV